MQENIQKQEEKIALKHLNRHLILQSPGVEGPERYRCGENRMESS